MIPSIVLCINTMHPHVYMSNIGVNPPLDTCTWVMGVQQPNIWEIMGGLWMKGQVEWARRFELHSQGM